MIAILCDICHTELEPRSKGNYEWFSKGGLVVLVGDKDYRRPARLRYQDKDVNEVCCECAAKCQARVWTNANGGVL